VVFGSLPQTYRDLILVINCGTTTNTNVFVSINGDATDGNYAATQISGSGTSPDGGDMPSFFSRILNNWGFPANAFNTNYIVQFIDYSATDKQKAYLSRSNNADNGTSLIVGRRADTAAIISVAVEASGTTFLAGSTFNLYGVIS